MRIVSIAAYAAEASGSYTFDPRSFSHLALISLTSFTHNITVFSSRLNLHSSTSSIQINSNSLQYHHDHQSAPPLLLISEGH